MLKVKIDLNLINKKKQKNIIKSALEKLKKSEKIKVVHPVLMRKKLKRFSLKKNKMFQFKKKQKLFPDGWGLLESSSSGGFAFKINRRFANKRFFYQYKLSQKRLLKNFYVDQNEPNKKIILLNNKQKKIVKRKENEPDFWLFIKPTVNNLFVYIYNIDVLRQKSILKKRKFFKKKKKKLRKIVKFNKLKKKRTYKVKFMCVSLGVSGYKGPTKTSYIAAEETGVLFSKKLHKKRLNVFNLVLLCRLNRRIRMFMKGLQRVNPLTFKYIYSMPRRAHNGSRVKKRRRK